MLKVTGETLLQGFCCAPRYIEGRLTAFALEVLFNPETTNWIPVTTAETMNPSHYLQFPLLLAQGVEGIAVGLSTTILPHNFCELCEAAIAHFVVKNSSFTLTSLLAASPT
jgi:topoisomerase-4 subunit A